MDHHHKKKNNSILSPFSQIYCSKKAIKLLLTLSLFSILFSYSLFSSLFSMKLFSCYNYSSTDRNYIFLLCNGILIFIFKNSGLFANAPSGTDNYAKKNVQSHQSTGFREYNGKKNIMSVSNVSSSQTNAVEEITKAVVEVDKAERAIISCTEEVGENGTLIAHNEEKEKEVAVVVELLNFVEEEEELVNMEEEEEEEEEEEGIELLSREELNKKCEEFIRKMKCGIKLEA